MSSKPPSRKKKKAMKAADRLRAHAEALMRVPSGEQYIGAIQSIVSIALDDVARALDELERRP